MTTFCVGSCFLAIDALSESCFCGTNFDEVWEEDELNELGDDDEPEGLGDDDEPDELGDDDEPDELGDDDEPDDEDSPESAEATPWPKLAAINKATLTASTPERDEGDVNCTGTPSRR